MIGNSLTHYRITAKLGEGGMGEVYRATDTKLGREVAIKVLPTSFSRDPQSLARFEREAKALASLNHPHIAAIHGFDVDQGTHFLVLELVEGQTLSERLRRGRLPVEEALRVARQIAEAVEAAHAKGIIHRDLKPGNIKFTPEGRVKVLDFGLAKMSHSGSAGVLAGGSPRDGLTGKDGGSPGQDASTLGADSTEPGKVMGTPAYMSPEQARGLEVDKRTDVWAFGCCLYECLSGRKPFQGKTASDLMADVLRSEPDWSQIPQETPPAVVTLLRRCLEKESSRRLSGMGDIAITLDESTRGPAASSSSHIPQPQSAPNPPPSPSATPAKWLWPAAAGLLILFIGAGFFFWKRSGAERQAPAGAGTGSTNVPRVSASVPDTDQKSIAVLPFLNMSADKDNEYFSDGITEEILNALARTPGLRVAARTSAFSFKGKNESVQRIGEALKVGVVLEGSVRRAGNQLRITAQLINVADGFSLWSDTFDRKAEDLFAIQTEVAQRVQEVLKVKLLAGGSPNATLAGTDNLEAYDLYLRGRHFWNLRTGADLERAVGLFQQATEKDPKFAAAYAGLGASYALLPFFAAMPMLEANPKARAAARRARELDDRLAEVHAVLGHCARFDWDWVGAEQEYQKALALNPNHATSHHWYALLLLHQEKTDQALAEIRQAQALDPLSPMIQCHIGLVHYGAGRHDEALVEVDKSLKLSPDFLTAYDLRGRIFLVQKRIPEAIAEFEKVRNKTGDTPFALGNLGHAYARAGRTNEARQILEKLKSISASGGSASYEIALVNLGLSDLDQAWVWLERAAESRDWDPRVWKSDPLLSDLIKDPRYAALLKKYGLDK